MILTKPKILMRLGLSAVLSCGTAMAQSTAQGETVLIKRAAQLREGPSESSRSVMALALQASVVRLGEKQGAWIKVSTPDNSQGWVHMFDVTASAGASASASRGNLGTRACEASPIFSTAVQPNRVPMWPPLL